MKVLFSILIVIILLCNPCYSDSIFSKAEIKTIYINSRLVDCVGVAPMKCMQIRGNEDEDWEFFYFSIEGFTFEAGSVYQIVVEIIPVENPPADAPSQSYRLIDVVSKEQVIDSSEDDDYTCFINTLQANINLR